jgi:trans-aconitate 2-methyltransferase
MADWEPEVYLQFADERSRPFTELLARVRTQEPDVVVDLGCGPGQLTATLADRWPAASVEGVDSSAAMVEAAARHASGRVRFRRADVADWRPERPVDVLVSNATLQWVPGHRSLLPGLVDALARGGWLAFQVPGNFDEPSHVLLRELAADPRFAAHTRYVPFPAAFDADVYLGDLTSLGCRVDAWETTYLHVLAGPDPVLRWISGTGARPILQALPTAPRAEFESEYAKLLRAAYPGHPFGTLLPFRRIFVVAQKGSCVTSRTVTPEGGGLS